MEWAPRGWPISQKAGRGAARRLRLLLSAALATGALSLASAAQDQPLCPERLKSATRLLTVTARDMATVDALVHLHERPSPADAWRLISGPMKGSLGRNGLGWGWDQPSLLANGEPEKHEGDGKTPAGIFALGRTFGQVPGPGHDFLGLRQSQSYCVDDLRSPLYNMIVSKRDAGAGTSGEDMGAIPLYRRGLLIAFPTSREAKGGSCIFIHIWRAPGAATSGCVALDEGDVASIQLWASKGPAVAALLPANARARFGTCLPAG